MRIMRGLIFSFLMLIVLYYFMWGVVLRHGMLYPIGSYPSVNVYTGRTHYMVHRAFSEHLPFFEILVPISDK